MPIIIRNTSMEPCTLPFPLQGVMSSGQRIVISLYTRAEALAVCPSLATGFEVTDLPETYSGSNDNATYGTIQSMYLGTLKDSAGHTVLSTDTNALGFYGATPVTQAATIAALAATPTLTGAATIDLTVLGTHLTSIRTELNAIRTALINIGIVASS